MRGELSLMVMVFEERLFDGCGFCGDRNEMKPC